MVWFCPHVRLHQCLTIYRPNCTGNVCTAVHRDLWSERLRSYGVWIVNYSPGKDVVTEQNHSYRCDSANSFSSNALDCVNNGLDKPLTVLPVMLIVASSMGFVFGPATSIALSQVREFSGTALAISGAIQFVLAGLAAPLVGIGGSGAILPLAVVALICALISFAGLVLGNMSARVAVSSRR